MRFSPRSKMSIILTSVTTLAVLATFMVMFVSHGANAQGATASASTVTYQGTPLKASQTTTSTGLPTKVVKPTRLSKNGPTDLESLNPFADNGPGDDAVTNSGAAAHFNKKNAAASPNFATGQLLHTFNGISDLNNDTTIGGELTPPDQGLCVGPLPSGGQEIVFEPVNDTIGEYTKSGTLLHMESLNTLFQDPNGIGDVRCFYDPSSKAFYFTEISFDATGNTVDELAVLDKHGFAVYTFPTSLGGNCFGDQPHVGYDNNNIYMATDEFCATYEGALLIAVSKSQLLQEVISPIAVGFGPVSLGGIPVLTLQPAVSTGINTEYLLNSFPFDAFGNSNGVENLLGFWQVKNGQNVTNGGSVTLVGQLISSETYGLPQPAASTGSGTVVATVSGFPITSEAFLNPDDDRMQSVQAVKDGSGVSVYAALNSAVLLSGDPSARDGVAWFKINAQAAKVSQQGYVSVAGSYIMYPTIIHGSDGTTALVFSITSPILNPSSAYTVMKAGASNFSGIHITALGASAHLSFSDAPPFSRARWGDYSATALDPGTGNIWGANEYIPPAADQGAFDNWGTNVFELAQ
ncbi:MAG TPA: hypothetical protein VKT82_01930 [Ktedonobacterales bacterium]|nr:hypothetical protein [Ktedonobacterales bacterium]